MLIYRGDLKPDLVVRLKQGPDEGSLEPVDLATASSIRIIGKRGDQVAFDREPTSTAGGEVTMEWQTADTDEPGVIKVEVEVTWPGAKPQTFRPSETVIVKRDYA